MHYSQSSLIWTSSCKKCSNHRIIKLKVWIIEWHQKDCQELLALQWIYLLKQGNGWSILKWEQHVFYFVINTRILSGIMKQNCSKIASTSWIFHGVSRWSSTTAVSHTSGSFTSEEASSHKWWNGAWQGCIFGTPKELNAAGTSGKKRCWSAKKRKGSGKHQRLKQCSAGLVLARRAAAISVGSHGA